MSLLFLLTRGAGDSVYDRIGAGGISRESDYGGGAPAMASDSPAAQAEREREIRQMLSARSERLVRRGESPLDVDAELARLLADEPGGRWPPWGLSCPSGGGQVRIPAARRFRILGQAGLPCGSMPC